MAVASRPPGSRPAKRAGSANPGSAATTKRPTRPTGPAKPAATAKAQPPAKPKPPAKSKPPAKPKPPGRAKPAGQAKPTGRSTATAKPARARVTRSMANPPVTRPMPRSARVSVSPTSAQRFAARVRARRRRRWLIVIAVLLVVAAVGWAVLKSPWATVQRIQVTGTHRVSTAAVRADAATEIGHPMLLARTADIATRVRGQRLVRSVRVQRHWPGVIRVQVVERVPVAALPEQSGVALVDQDGVTVQQATRAPAGLPLIDVNLGSAGVDAMRGCLEVLRQLPIGISTRLTSIGADSLDGIWLKMAGGVKVEWGSSSDTVHKSQVLVALLKQHASNYDLRSPDAPAIRAK